MILQLASANTETVVYHTTKTHSERLQFINKASSAGGKSWRQTTVGSIYFKSSLNRGATVFISIYLFPGQICKISHQSSFAALKWENISNPVTTINRLAHRFYFHSLLWRLLRCQVETQHLTGQIANHGRAGEEQREKVRSQKPPPRLIRARGGEATNECVFLSVLLKKASSQHFLGWITYSVWAFGDVGLNARAASISALWFSRWIKMKLLGGAHSARCLINETKVSCTLVSQCSGESGFEGKEKKF